MNKRLSNCVIAISMGIIGLGKIAGLEAAVPKSQLAVCVRNYAEVPASTIGEAERIAQRIFDRAGVETMWMDQVLPSADGQPNPAVNASCASSLPGLFVNLVSREMAASLGLANNILGLAPGTTQESDRRTVFVLDQVASELARKQRTANKSVILGHVMAHELGHILARIEKHPSKGLMRASWQEEDFEAMVVGLLNFNPEQAARIRAELALQTRPQTLSVVALYRNENGRDKNRILTAENIDSQQ